jgi:hypothetical protein
MRCCRRRCWRCYSTRAPAYAASAAHAATAAISDGDSTAAAAAGRAVSSHAAECRQRAVGCSQGALLHCQQAGILTRPSVVRVCCQQRYVCVAGGAHAHNNSNRRSIAGRVKQAAGMLTPRPEACRQRSARRRWMPPRATRAHPPSAPPAACSQRSPPAPHQRAGSMCPLPPRQEAGAPGGGGVGTRWCQQPAWGVFGAVATHACVRVRRCGVAGKHAVPCRCRAQGCPAP